MPFVLAILAAIGGVIFWMLRARSAAHGARELMDMANDVRLAARRFGFRRNAGQHPVESIEEAPVAVATLGVAYLELDGLPSREQQVALGRGLQRELGLSLGDAEELVILGRWLVNECGGPLQAVPRTARKLYKLDGGASFSQMLGVFKEISGEAGGAVSERQAEALADIKRAFHIS
ncbi:MAG TPA: hypothetical protein ENK83_01285 [Aliiroseovarius sp.]|nr:hypothetical protein [Aliiroseovarius sp.]